MKVKVRCPVCNGTGGVEPDFGTGSIHSHGGGYVCDKSTKRCPACNGTGMQEVTRK